MPAHALEFQDEFDVLAGRQYVHQVVGLEHEPDAPQAQLRQLALAERVDTLARDPHFEQDASVSSEHRRERIGKPATKLGEVDGGRGQVELRHPPSLPTPTTARSGRTVPVRWTGER